MAKRSTQINTHHDWPLFLPTICQKSNAPNEILSQVCPHFATKISWIYNHRKCQLKFSVCTDAILKLFLLQINYYSFLHVLHYANDNSNVEFIFTRLEESRRPNAKFNLRFAQQTPHIFERRADGTWTKFHISRVHISLVYSSLLHSIS